MGLTTVSNSSSRGCDTLLLPTQAPGMYVEKTYMKTKHAYTQNKQTTTTKSPPQGIALHCLFLHAYIYAGAYVEARGCCVINCSPSYFFVAGSLMEPVAYGFG